MLLIDQSTLLMGGAAVLGGFVRGFAGFGGALIFMPLATMLVEPSLAILIICALELPSALWLLRQAWRMVRVREILLIAAGATFASPLGVQILLMLERTTLRWIICGLILLAVAFLASGWRYRGATPPPVSMSIGLASGLSGSIAAVGLPPVVLLWLSSRTEPAAVTRANILAYSVFLIVVVGISMATRGLMTTEVITNALIILPFFIAAAWVGERHFAGTSDRRYTHAALVICATAAIVGLPVW
jgi:uncharacterized membrane protein YfcA